MQVFFFSRSSIPQRKHAYPDAPAFSKVRECADTLPRVGRALARRAPEPPRQAVPHASSGLEAVSEEMCRLPVAPPARR